MLQILICVLVYNENDFIEAIGQNTNPIHIASSFSILESLNLAYLQSTIIGNSYTITTFDQKEPLFLDFRSSIKNTNIVFHSRADYDLNLFASTVYASSFEDLNIAIDFIGQVNCLIYQDFRNSNITAMFIEVKGDIFNIFYSVSQSELMTLDVKFHGEKAEIAYSTALNSNFSQIAIHWNIETQGNLLAPTANNISILNAIINVNVEKTKIANTMTEPISFVNVLLDKQLTELDCAECTEQNVEPVANIGLFKEELNEHAIFFNFENDTVCLTQNFSTLETTSYNKRFDYLEYELPNCRSNEFKFGLICTVDACDIFNDVCNGIGECLFFNRYFCNCDEGFDGANACKTCNEGYTMQNGNCYEIMDKSKHGLCWKQNRIIICQCDPGYTDRYCDKTTSWQLSISVWLSICCAVVICFLGFCTYRSVTWWKREEQDEDKIPLQI